MFELSNTKAPEQPGTWSATTDKNLGGNVDLPGGRQDMQRVRLPHGRRLAAGVATLAALGLGVFFLLRPAGTAQGVSFRTDVQPIFDNKCAVCHPTSYPYLDLRQGHSYDDLVRVSSALQPAFERVLPGRPELSYLLTHVPDPSRENLLTAADRTVINQWILEGARND